MLVNVSFDPRSRVKVEKNHRLMRKEYPGNTSWSKEFRKSTRWHQKAYSFNGFFIPYKPASWEYTKADPNEDFTGVYIVRNSDVIDDMVNLLTRQHAQNMYADENYESGDVWYSFGLCDNANQAIKYYKEMKNAGRFHGNHIITLMRMGKSGWRWHKWGAYIGDFQHKCEYFCDEVGIEDVWHFCIIRVY